jgi:hypothetical protein
MNQLFAKLYSNVLAGKTIEAGRPGALGRTRIDEVAAMQRPQVR